MRWDRGGRGGSDPAARERRSSRGRCASARRLIAARLERASVGACGGGDRWGWGLKSTEGEEAGGLFEVEAGAELAGGGAEDAAAEGGVEGAEAVDFDGDGGLAGGGADGTASAADGFAGEQELGQEAAIVRLASGILLHGLVRPDWLRSGQ